ncbi:hypothetical protein J3R82DRAFT_1764 [Butyriboletus roseoflavus]|nr:hypothetical protein J3R82DRAFT_1764 [Butyriboletus roseoflavus]
MLFSAENSSWKANDLNIYVSISNTSCLVDFLVTARFMCHSLHYSNPYGNSSISTIATFCCDAIKVDMIELCTHIPLSPIFEFHLMIVMNYFSADAIFSTYPSLTY